ncbi:MAG: riboflavin synthase [Spirochaetia bacterium]|nr:riboflavin synthase [Spirochaetia bacterium]
MFTGLIESTGRIKAVTRKVNGIEIEIVSSQDLKLKPGDSIAVNGCCQTIEKINKKNFSVFSVPETLKITNLKNLKEKDLVNLETALTLEKKIGGHIVQGHIENTGEINKVEKFENYWDVEINYSSEYIIPKGSVALDGISLTIHEIIKKNIFRVQLIPETIKRTNVINWSKGYSVNIETDYIIKAFDYIKNYRNS